MQPLSWEIGFLGCRFQLFELHLPSKQSHYCGNQQKLRTLQESFTPVQSFAAETYFFLIIRAVGAGPAGPAAAGPIFGQLTRAKMPYELWWVVQLLL